MPARLLALLLVLLVAGCGDLPQPFAGRPGATAMRLAQPPPARLAVPVPGNSLLSDQNAAVWAVVTAHALVDLEVPAVAARTMPGDWRLVLSARLSGNQVVPAYTVLDPKGRPKGTMEGSPVRAADWARSDPALLGQAAAQAAPQVATLLTAIEASIRQSDPNSLVNRPARIYFSGVTGAPGDGNASLARQLRLLLPDQGDMVQDTPAGADFAVRGVVKTSPDVGGTERVEIQWIVADSRGKEAGRVAQLNDVPKGSLDAYWGDVARVITQQAAGGIHDVITNQSGRHPPRPAATHGPAPGAAG